jgi:HSP20 family protein
LILPDDVEKDKISAKVEHGVLNVIIPKMTETEKPSVARQIEIK